MNEQLQEERKSWVTRLGEDWLAVIIGLALVAFTGLGVIVEVPWPLLVGL